ncbi:hypothetical protein [Nocardiopsis sp. JB363]|uniref:hypothetical protein n=1 Tax=Nocardiopsis sp. JB363 TaxID=1434837 RepID=UPI000B350697|nr:hypothetical protein [Nocardiopsis sp. JB363]
MIAEKAAPGAAHTWWNSLSKAEQETAMEVHPDLLRDLDGIPSTLRGVCSMGEQTWRGTTIPDTSTRNRPSTTWAAWPEESGRYSMFDVMGRGDRSG